MIQLYEQQKDGKEVTIAVSKNLNFLLYIYPVSYTHLDVYKRQLITRFTKVMDLRLIDGNDRHFTRCKICIDHNQYSDQNKLKYD